MPVVTRSCSKQMGRPRIEDETPASSNTYQRRYPTRSSAKRKILHHVNDNKDVEPPSKRAVNSKSCRSVPKACKIPSQNDGNKITKEKDDRGKPKAQASRIPKRCLKENKSGMKPTSEKEAVKDCNEAGKENNEIQLSVQRGLFCSSVLIEAVPKTPSCCNAARIKTYSAFRRSQRKNKSQACCNLADKGNNSLCYTGTPLEEINFNSMEVTLSNRDEGCNQEQTGHSACDDNDDDIHCKKNQHNVVEMSQSLTEEDGTYKEKYFAMMSSMKELQRDFLRAQQNVEKNLKAYNNFVSGLKASLKAEKQKNTLLGEELRIKKGAVERLRSDLDNTKEQLKFLKEEKDVTEKQDKEKTEKVPSFSDKSPNTHDSEKKKSSEDKQSLINFYAKLTGLVISCDNTCTDDSLFQSFHCNFALGGHSNNCLQFRLTHDKEFDEIEYSPKPKSPASEDILLNFPAHLRENIFFGSDHAPMFLSQLVKTLKD